MADALLEAAAPVADAIVEDAVADTAGETPDAQTEPAGEGSHDPDEVRDVAGGDDDAGAGEVVGEGVEEVVAGEGAPAGDQPGDVDGAAVAEAVEPAKQQPEAEESAEDKQFTEAWGKFVPAFNELLGKAQAGTVDLLDEKSAAATVKTLMDGIVLLNQKVERERSAREGIEQQQKAETSWGSWSKETGIPVDQGKKLWGEVLAVAQKSWSDPKQAYAVATDRFRERVERIKAARTGKAPAASNNPPKSTTAAPPVNPGGAKVTPATSSGSPKPPPPKRETAAEQLFKKYGPLHKTRLY